MGLQYLPKVWPKIVIWALMLGILVSVPADWGRWDRLPLNLILRVLITAVGGVAGLLLDHFASFYVGMGTNVIESMGVVKFSKDSMQKIQNSFIFTGAFIAAVITFIFIR